MDGLVLGIGWYNIRRVEEWRWGKERIVNYKMLLTSIFKWTCGERSQHLISTSIETCQKRSLIFVRYFYFPWKSSVSSANDHSPADFSQIHKLSRFKKIFDFILPNVQTHMDISTGLRHIHVQIEQIQVNSCCSPSPFLPHSLSTIYKVPLFFFF